MLLKFVPTIFGVFEAGYNGIGVSFSASNGDAAFKLSIYSVQCAFFSSVLRLAHFVNKFKFRIFFFVVITRNPKYSNA